MPLVGYHLIGFDPEFKESGFDKKDYWLLQHSSHIKKVSNFFENCPHRINLIFDNTTDDPNRLMLYGRLGNSRRQVFNEKPFDAERDWGHLSHIEKVILNKLLHHYLISDAINYVYTNNFGPKPRIPMTPWIIAHRMGHIHVLDHEKIIGKASIADTLICWNNEQMRNIYSNTHINGLFSHCPVECCEDNTLIEHSLLKSLVTSRAGREGSISGFEYVPEWFAQYLRFGEVRLPKEVPEKLNLQYIYRNDMSLRREIPDIELVANSKKLTIDLKNKLEDLFEAILKMWVGEILIT